MSQTDLTPVHVFTLLASTIFSAAVAGVVGPYIVIAIGAMAGSAISLMQRPSMGRLNAFLFFAGAVLVSILLTVNLSMLLAGAFTAVQEHWLFAPVSFGLGYLGGKWGDVLTWLGTKINALVDILIQLRGKP